MLMSEPLFSYKFVSSTLNIFENHIEVIPGLLEKKLSDKKIELSNVAEVILQEPNMLTRGTLHIALYRADGSYFAVRKFSDQMNGEARNYFLVSKAQAENARKLKDYIHDWLNKNGSRNRNRNSEEKVDKTTQLKALEELLKNGLISKSDFDSQQKLLK